MGQCELEKVFRFLNRRLRGRFAINIKGNKVGGRGVVQETL